MNVPTEAEVAEAREAVKVSVRELSDAAESVVVRLSRLTNPVERAKAAMEVRRFTAAEVTSATDGLFRDAVIEAYARGRAEHGWYGYGALAEDLGISRARVQQVVVGTWKPGGKDAAHAASIRASADQERAVRRLLGAGWSAEDVAETLGMKAEAVRDLDG